MKYHQITNNQRNTKKIQKNIFIEKYKFINTTKTIFYYFSKTVFDRKSPVNPVLDTVGVTRTWHAQCLI